uniref:Uncharacterized protein n=1 Tax=Phenylobacterium glaciei TaxID=2803784 RepID=A0A974SAJ2_9CAUL|nr:hypothetical protein JKL49_05065 [Phenylobacterium glaciei]
MTDKAFLDGYRSPGVFTGLDGFEDQIDALPAEVGAVAAFVHGLLIHEGLAAAYGVTLAPGRFDEKQIHGTTALLRQAMRLHDRPITEPRAPEHRVVGVCRHFAVLFAAVMRRKGFPPASAAASPTISSRASTSTTGSASTGTGIAGCWWTARSTTCSASSST